MTTFPSNQSRDWTDTQAAPWRNPAPEVPTMGAFFPPTQARPGEPLAPPRQAYGPVYGSPYTPDLAWAAEQPEFNSYAAAQPRYARPKLLGFAAAGLVAVAAAGLFGALHSSSSSTPVNAAAQSAPAPAPPPAPAPAPMPAAHPSTPSYRSASHSAMSGGGYPAPVTHQAPPQTPPAPQSQPSGDPSGSSYNGGGSDPSQWNNSGNYSWTHSRDHDSRWSHDNRWTFWNRDHDNDNRSSHDDSRWSNNRSSDSHSSDSSGSGDSR